MLESFTDESVSMGVGVFLCRLAAFVVYVLCLSQYESIRSLRNQNTNWTGDNTLCHYMYILW